MAQKEKKKNRKKSDMLKVKTNKTKIKGSDLRRFERIIRLIYITDVVYYMGVQ